VFGGYEAMSDGDRMMRRKLAPVLVVLLLSTVLPPPCFVATSAEPGVQSCDAVARDLFGATAVRPKGSVKAPKKLRNVQPVYPDIPAGTKGSGGWVGEALVAPDGDVRQIMVLRDLEFAPPLPEFSQSIVRAIQQWRFAPTIVDGKKVPLCMVVSVNIHWR
jgi:hypothetical protein